MELSQEINSVMQTIRQATIAARLRLGSSPDGTLAVAAERGTYTVGFVDDDGTMHPAASGLSFVAMLDYLARMA